MTTGNYPPPPSKMQLLASATRLMADFCRLNALQCPTVEQCAYADWPHDVCAYYRPVKVAICVARCAAIGTQGRAWSFPGYIIDRTPYGVVAHEVGHHADREKGAVKGPYYSEFSTAVRNAAGEAPLTNYCPNDWEFFAESFRLFVTNPTLLRLIRPRTYREIRAARYVPIVTRDWREILATAPGRTLAMAERRIEEARAAA